MSISHLINANIHRVKEGARVLEDCARFVLRDETLFNRIRKLRHHLPIQSPALSSGPDLGGPSLREDNLRSDLIALVQANVVRMQEGLRVLEEFSPDRSQKEGMKTLRYEAYALQQALYLKTLGLLKQDKLKGVYPVIDTDLIHLPLKEIITLINKTKVNLIQLRSKSLCKRDFIKQAVQCRELLAPSKLLIINDHVDVAIDIADGVHLGQSDYPLARVRRWAPDHFILGATCHSVKEAIFAQEAGASYLSIGCLFPTSSKKDTIPTSLAELEKIHQATQLPICAIGGITPQNLPLLAASKVNMIAVISAIWQNTDPLASIEAIDKQMRNHQLE